MIRCDDAVFRRCPSCAVLNRKHSVPCSVTMSERWSWRISLRRWPLNRAISGTQNFGLSRNTSVPGVDQFHPFLQPVKIGAENIRFA